MSVKAISLHEAGLELIRNAGTSADPCSLGPDHHSVLLLAYIAKLQRETLEAIAQLAIEIKNRRQ